MSLGLSDEIQLTLLFFYRRLDFNVAAISHAIEPADSPARIKLTVSLTAKRGALGTGLILFCSLARS